MRGRLLLALLATSAVTLFVAAVALLGPLSERLRNDAVTSLRTAILTDRPGFEAALRPREAESRLFRLQVRAQQLRRRADARVLVFTELPRLLYDTETGSPSAAPLRATLQALRAEETAVLRQGDQVTVAVRLFDARGVARGTIVAQRRLTQVAETTDAVRRAVLAAAAAGLLVALLLGIALSARLSQRLGRLRDAARRITADGPDAPAPVDAGRDEVGELARAFGAMQQSLRRQEEARRAFVATASHELRTPLTMLQGTFELLQEDLNSADFDPEDARRQVAGAQREVRRLARLATELLDLSRLDAGVPLRREPVELVEIARAVAAEFALAADDRDVELELHPPPGPCWAGGDPGAVARVARILLENALRYGAPGRPVRLTAAYHGERATLEVADAGDGVDPADRERIFERFERGRSSDGGFGLGLAIGRELARRMDGDLLLVDDSGPGARFRLELPIELPTGGAQDLPG